MTVTEIKRLCLRSQSSESFVNQKEERKFREGQGLAFYPSGLAHPTNDGREREMWEVGKEKSLLGALALSPCQFFWVSVLFDLSAAVTLLLTTTSKYPTPLLL